MQGWEQWCAKDTAVYGHGEMGNQTTNIWTKKHKITTVMDTELLSNASTLTVHPHLFSHFNCAMQLKKGG